MAHTLGMFGLSWLTGGLIDRFGRIQMIVAGTLVLALSCILAPLSLQLPILGLALFLLGLGWNFTYVAGSSLLSDALAAHERARAQGASEALVAVASGLASLSVGLVFAQGQYLLVSAIALVFTLLLLLITFWLVRKERREADLLIAETGSYRVLRHWLQGPDAGATDKLFATVPVVTAWQTAMRKAKEGNYTFRVPKFQPRSVQRLPPERAPSICPSIIR